MDDGGKQGGLIVEVRFEIPACAATASMVVDP
jgi:hypothetical protein